MKNYPITFTYLAMPVKGWIEKTCKNIYLLVKKENNKWNQIKHGIDC